MSKADVFIFPFIKSLRKQISVMEILPNELLASIFKHLSQQDLIRTTRICQRFNSVIAGLGLIKKLHIVGRQNDAAINDALMIPKRKYSEARVSNFIQGAHLKVIEAVGDQLTRLELDRSTLKLIHFVEVLRATPNVKFLTFCCVKFINSLSRCNELPRLQCSILKFSDSDPDIFCALQNISVVQVELNFEHIAYWDFAEFNKFLKSQTSLTSLSLKGIRNSNLFDNLPPKPTYKLKEFAINGCCSRGCILRNIHKFWMKHVETIKKCVIEKISWDPSSILNKCKSLKSLECQSNDELVDNPPDSLRAFN